MMGRAAAPSGKSGSLYLPGDETERAVSYLEIPNLILDGLCSGCDPTDLASFIEPLGHNVGLVTPFAPISILASFVATAGWPGISDSMAGGPGAILAKVRLLVYLISTAVAVRESGFFIGAAAAPRDGDFILAETFLTVQNSVGSLTVGAKFLEFAVISARIFVQKNLNAILASLIMVFGACGTVLSKYDYDSQLMIVPYASQALLSVILVVLFF